MNIALIPYDPHGKSATERLQPAIKWSEHVDDPRGFIKHLEERHTIRVQASSSRRSYLKDAIRFMFPGRRSPRDGR